MPINWNVLNQVSYNVGSGGGTYPVLGVYDVVISSAVSTTTPAYIPVTIQVENTASIPLYFQLTGNVQLASGSIASITVTTQNLGSIAPDTTAYFSVNLFNITSTPLTNSSSSAYETETLGITLNVYTDSAYTNLFETSTYNTYFSFINPANTAWSIYDNYQGTNSTSGYNLSTSTLVPTFVTSPVVVTNGYALEINSSTVPAGQWIGFPSNGNEYNVPAYGYLTYIMETLVNFSTTSFTSTTPIQFFNGFGSVNCFNIYNPYISNIPASNWYIIYAIGGSYNSNGSFSAYLYYSKLQSFTNFTHYVGYQRTLIINTVIFWPVILNDI